MICSGCKTVLAAEMKFCPECGTRTSTSTASRQSVQEPLESMGAMRTLAGQAEPSLGDCRTMTGGSRTDDQRDGESNHPLAERYEILEEVGHGGFAVVYKARDRKLDRLVAVKRLRPLSANDRNTRQTIERFRREAQAIAKLNHRNIVAVYDHDEDADGHYIVMEYVDNGSLRERLRMAGGKFPVPEAVRLLRGIARGLAYAHRKNLVHRDIKPGNILLARDTAAEGSGDAGVVPKIVDFGLARAGGESDVSVSGYGMGTPFYMAPEQRRDAKNVNHTADIYALGKTFYEMLTGEPPDNVDPEAIPPPPEIARVILRCIKSNPEDRYFSAEELLADLDQIAENTPSRATRAKKPGSEAACPSCGVENEPDARFCASCGTGLFRSCPECGREMRATVQFCVACGTDAPSLLKLQEARDKVRRYLDEKRYTRVAKEVELLGLSLFAPRGKEGKTVVEDLLAARRTAEESESRRKALDQDIAAAWQRNDYDAVEKALGEMAALSDGLSEAHERLRGRLPVARQFRVLRDYLANLEKAIGARDWKRAQMMLSAAPAFPGAAADEDRHDEASIREALERLRLRLSTDRLTEFTEMLKRQTDEARVAREGRNWQAALDAVSGQAPVPDDLLPQDRAAAESLLEERARRQEQTIQDWFSDLTAQTERLLAEGQFETARSVLSAIGKMPVSAQIRRNERTRLEKLVIDAQAARLRRDLADAMASRDWAGATLVCDQLLGLLPGDATTARARNEAGRQQDFEDRAHRIAFLCAEKRFEDAFRDVSRLMDDAGPTHEVTCPPHLGPLSDLEAAIRSWLSEQRQRLALMRPLRDKHEWKELRSVAEAFLTAYPRHPEAHSLLTLASRRIRSRRLGTAAFVVAATVLVSALGILSYDWIRLHSGIHRFNRSLATGDFVAARQAAAGIRLRYEPASKFGDIWESWSVLPGLREWAETRNTKARFPDSWRKAETAYADLHDDLCAARFENARERADVVRHQYEALLSRNMTYLTAVDQRERELAALIGEQTAQRGLLDEHGGAEWRDLAGTIGRLRRASSDPAADLRAIQEARHALSTVTTTAQNRRAGLEARRAQGVAGYRTMLAGQDPMLLRTHAAAAWREAQDLAGLAQATNLLAACDLLDRANSSLGRAATQAAEAVSRERDRIEQGYQGLLSKLDDSSRRCDEAASAVPAKRTKPSTHDGVTAASAAVAAIDAYTNTTDFAGLLSFAPGRRDELRRSRDRFMARKDEFYVGPVEEEAWRVPELEIDFVWVRSLGLWVSRFEVTNAQFRKQVASHRSGAFEQQSLDADEQPAVNVSFDDCEAFTQWLTARERERRRLPPNRTYRMPTATEWQMLASCGQVRAYPWGDLWPPDRPGVNLMDAAFQRQLPKYSAQGIGGYADRFVVSCEVAHAESNEWGICGMGGNVSEWTLESRASQRAVRGASWRIDLPDRARTAERTWLRTGERLDDVGFRVVLGADAI